jgi:hypothetical protein
MEISDGVMPRGRMCVERYLHLLVLLHGMVHGPYQVIVLMPNIHLRILVGAGDANSRIMTSIFPSWCVAVDMTGVAPCSKGRRWMYVTIMK